VSKWQSIVKSNREAPTLKFEGPREGLPKVAVSTTALAASFKPENDLEAEVAAMLEAAGAHDGRAVEEAEEALALKKLTVEEAQKRRVRSVTPPGLAHLLALTSLATGACVSTPPASQAKLAKMRSLLFQHETKAKHLKKIKSKAYHRKLKKWVSESPPSHAPAPATRMNYCCFCFLFFSCSCRCF
jgi:U3 small nucleolar RNA-associated protein 14